MANITLKNNPIHTLGELPAIGSSAPDFRLVKVDLGEASLKDFAGSTVILNIFPSIDTGTCAASVRRFNVEAAKLANTKVLCISRDLPFAQKRFCGAEGIENVVMLSDFRDASFAKAYNLLITDGPLQGLTSRCIVVIDAAGKIKYTEQVAETTNEPNYEKALESLK